MDVICAWCEAEKPEAERDTRPGISHGICKAHLQQMREAVAKRKATNAATAPR